MLHTHRTITRALAVLLVAGVMAPAAANAWSFGKKTKTDASTVQGQGTNIVVQIYNRGTISQDLKMGEQVYTVQPHQTITLKGASGTDVYADTAGNGYQKGERLFQFAPAMNGATVKLN